VVSFSKHEVVGSILTSVEFFLLFSRPGLVIKIYLRTSSLNVFLVVERLALLSYQVMVSRLGKRFVVQIRD